MFVLGAALRSGYQYFGDGEIFVFRDGLFSFLIGLLAVYITTLSVCSIMIKLPVFDLFGRIVATNILTYGLLGFSLVHFSA